MFQPEALDEKQLKRVRYDVFKLGMSGFHKEKKEDTRVALAIKLGAKPPRNKVWHLSVFLVGMHFDLFLRTSICEDVIG